MVWSFDLAEFMCSDPFHPYLAAIPTDKLKIQIRLIRMRMIPAMIPQQAFSHRQNRGWSFQSSNTSWSDVARCIMKRFRSKPFCSSIINGRQKAKLSLVAFRIDLKSSTMKSNGCRSWLLAFFSSRSRDVTKSKRLKCSLETNCLLNAMSFKRCLSPSSCFRQALLISSLV